MEEKFALISYNRDIKEAHSSANLDELLAYVANDRISWLTMGRCQEPDRPTIVKLLSFFAVDPAFAEKILNGTPREFSDDEPACIFVKYSIPLPIFDTSHNAYVQAQGSMIVGDRFLLLFQESDHDYSDLIRRRLPAGRTRVQEFGVDYLLYLLLRGAIAQVQSLIDYDLKNRFEKLEDEVIASSGEEEILDKLLAEREHVKVLYEPLRRLEVFLIAVRDGEVPFITEQTESLFTQNLRSDFDWLEKGYERLLTWWAQLLELHRANVGESTDKIMNMLTIVSTLFLPITFISGFYGMNFINMPGVNNPYGFAITVLVMIAIVLLTVIYMWKKRYFK